MTLSPRTPRSKIMPQNFGARTRLTTHTYPANQVRKAIVMKFDLSQIPANALIQSATLQLYLVGGDGFTTDPNYAVSLHRILNVNANPAQATGYCGRHWPAVDGQHLLCERGAHGAVRHFRLAGGDDHRSHAGSQDMERPEPGPGVAQRAGHELRAAAQCRYDQGCRSLPSFREHGRHRPSRGGRRCASRFRYRAASIPPRRPCRSARRPTTRPCPARASTVGNGGRCRRCRRRPVPPRRRKPGAEDTTAPYSISWNTTTASNGEHVLTAIARDAAGNSTTSTAVTVTVNNAPTNGAPMLTRPRIRPPPKAARCRSRWPQAIRMATP